MEVKDLINFLIEEKRGFVGEYQEKIDGFIEIVQQGEKCWQMWDEFKKKYGNYWGAFDVRELNSKWKMQSKNTSQRRRKNESRS